MDMAIQIYEFAASAGALEGFLYQKKNLDMDSLIPWVNNLLTAYEHLPPDVREQIQSSVDQTIGRAIHSAVSLFGEENEVKRKLESMIVGPIPKSPDDFEKKKWFER